MAQEHKHRFGPAVHLAFGRYEHDRGLEAFPWHLGKPLGDLLVGRVGDSLARGEPPTLDPPAAEVAVTVVDDKGLLAAGHHRTL